MDKNFDYFSMFKKHVSQYLHQLLGGGGVGNLNCSNVMYKKASEYAFSFSPLPTFLRNNPEKIDIGISTELNFPWSKFTRCKGAQRGDLRVLRSTMWQCNFQLTL